MPKNLVIVESPAKAKTIEKFLGKEYKVMSSYGHIRDLHKKDFSIDFDHDYAPIYEIPSEKKELVKELKKAANDADMVWLASDEDREGEAIAWHLYEVLGLTPEKTRRIVFHEITKPAILHAIANPRGIDYNLVDAQQARRVLDRIVGFELSPVLWKKIKPALSNVSWRAGCSCTSSRVPVVLGKRFSWIHCAHSSASIPADRVIRRCSESSLTVLRFCRTRSFVNATWASFPYCFSRLRRWKAFLLSRLIACWPRSSPSRLGCTTICSIVLAFRKRRKTCCESTFRRTTC